MLKRFFTILAPLCFLLGVNAQAQTPTAQQMELFKSLPADQQQALAAQYGVSLPSTSGTASSASYQEVPVVAPRVEATQVIEAAKSKESKSDTATDKKNVLTRFGVELFASSPSTFAPISDVPIPSNYNIGAGDEFIIQLFGKENTTHRLVVNREGLVQFPSLGPIQVAGMTFSQAQEALTQRISEQIIGVRSNISLGKLRSMQIFVMGEAYKPGAYTVSALTTISQAIYYSGGFSKKGALRNVQLKRDGKVIRQLDLYDLLLKGDTSNDVRLLAGDVVLINPVQDLVRIDGEINRPALYELKTGEQFKDIVRMAGGFTANAYLEQVTIKRYAPQDKRELLTLNFSAQSVLNRPVQRGDSIEIAARSKLIEDYIQIQGAVKRPGFIEWKSGLKVADLLSSLKGDVQDSAELNYALIVREMNEKKEIQALQFNLANAILDPSSADNLSLQSRDQILVFTRYGAEEGLVSIPESQENITRKALLAPVLLRLQQQSTLTAPRLAVSINGDTRYPGQYPLTKEMTIADLVTAAGGVNESTDVSYALLVREINERKEIEVQQFNLAAAVLNPTGKDNIKLQARDKVLVFNRYGDNEDQATIPENKRNSTRSALLSSVLIKLRQQTGLDRPIQTVTVFGEVHYPGIYPLISKMSVSQLLSAAGGVTYDAYTFNAELARPTLESETQSVVTEIYQVNLEQALVGDSTQDLPLAAGDRLNVLEKPDVKYNAKVTLKGEVRFPGTYTVRRGETLGQLLARAGGLTDYAYPQGAVFTREELRKQEQKLLEQYAEDIRRETAKQTFRADKNIASSISDPDKTLKFVEEATKSKALGRMVVQLSQILSLDSAADFMLEDGDFLHVPVYRNTVSIMGEVQMPITYPLDRRLDVDDYINRAGGMKKQADEDRIFVVRADGSIYKPTSGFWFGNNKQDLRAGDTIIVPLDTDYRDALSFWSAATQILYQTGVAVNALK